MAWRPNQSVSIVDLAARHRAERRIGSAGGQQGDVIAAHADRRLRPGEAARGADPARLTDRLDMTRRVHPLEILDRDRRNRQQLETVNQPADLNEVVQTPLAAGAFEV